MRVGKLRLVVVVALFGFANVPYVASYGQNSPQNIAGPAQVNPFDYALGLTATKGSTRTAPNSKTLALSTSSQLQHREPVLGGSKQAKQLINELTVKYGEPSSIRGGNHVWTIKNPDKSGVQADVVTIIVSLNPTGNSELIMDRDRGENGLATWALPRRNLQQATPQAKAKQLQAKKLLENPN